jgi:hypothetical protein
VVPAPSLALPVWFRSTVEIEVHNHRRLFTRLKEGKNALKDSTDCGNQKAWMPIK